jgi:predicted O-methyltransferase YrrM
MRRRIEGYLRRVARRYLVTRRSWDGLEARYYQLEAQRNQVAAEYAALVTRHDELGAAKSQADAEYADLLDRHEKVVAERDELEATYRTWAPPGHFYSPYPDKDEISRRAKAIFDAGSRLEGINLRDAEQVELFDRLASFANDMPFSEKSDGEHRFFFDNPEYSWSDATILHAMLRHIRPKRVIEVGSGYSSMMILDTVDGWLDKDTELTFIEPYPFNLNKLLRPGDEERVTILEQAVQDVPLDTFTALESGDLLFIDSTHVVKAGSDVNYLFFEVLPRLNNGVWIHVHDIFFPFEYPLEWVVEGRAWQEVYLLRAFLMYNQRFEIRWYQQYMWTHHRDLLAGRLPQLARNSGGNKWLQKVPEA